MSRGTRRLKAVCSAATAITLALLVGMALHDPVRAELRALLSCAALVSSTCAYLGLALLRRRSGAGRTGRQALALAAFCALVLLCAGELRFSTLDRSHSINCTLAGKLWLARHYRFNSYRHRGPEPDARALESKRRIVVLGDSFAAGHGVEESQRFSDLLIPRIPSDHVVVNISVSGENSLCANIP